MLTSYRQKEQITGLAVDFGGTKIAAARYLNGEQLSYLQVPTQAQRTVSEQVAVMAELLNQLKLSDDDRVCVAVTGRVDQQGNWYAVNKDTLSKIDCVPLKSLLNQKLQRQVHLLNDCVAGAIGEAHYGAGMGLDNFAYISVSTGVGGVCFLRGEALTSANGLAGHMGFMSSRYSDQRCGSGRMATVESVASGRAIAQLATQSGFPNLTAKQVYARHQTGDLWATQLINRSAQAIADLSVNLGAALGIENAVIGGSIGLAPGYIELAQQQVNLEPDLFKLTLKAATLGQESVLYGSLA